MKISIAFTVLILAVGGWMCLSQQKQITILMKDRDALEHRASSLGLNVSSSSGENEKSASSGRERGGDSVDIGALAKEFISLAREMDAVEKQGESPSRELKAKGFALLSRLANLNSTDLKSVIATLQEDTSLSPSVRREIITMSIVILADEHPSAALDICAGSPDLFGDSELGNQILGAALVQMSELQPQAALDWIAKNAASFPDFDAQEARVGVIEGVAKHDPALAFGLIGNMATDDRKDAIRVIVEIAGNAEERTKMLDSLRSYLGGAGTGEDGASIMEDALDDMARNSTKENFEQLSFWIERSDLSPEEKAQFAGGLSYFNTQKDTGAWIEWMEKNLPASHLKDQVDDLIGQWTQHDYIAAGEWLASSAEGPAKQAAVTSYAATVAEYDPQTAAQWAMTLPEGAERRMTLEAIHRNWPKSDAAGAEEFAKANGLTPIPKEEP